MSRVCCCSVSHADDISSITTIQLGDDAMRWAQRENHHEIVSVLEQVVRAGVVVVMVCVYVCVCVTMLTHKERMSV